jgi:hypothetical protein
MHAYMGVFLVVVALLKIYDLRGFAERAHNCTIVRRNGEWEFLETPDLKQAKLEINELNETSFSGSAPLTPRERVVLR